MMMMLNCIGISISSRHYIEQPHTNYTTEKERDSERESVIGWAASVGAMVRLGNIMFRWNGRLVGVSPRV